MDISPNDGMQVAWAVWLASWLIAALWSGRNVRRPHSRNESLYRLIVALGALLLFALHPRWPALDVVLWHPGRDAGWTLVLVAVIGFAFAWWARIVLGRLWSSAVARKANHVVVTTGPYRLVRHPIYSGILLAVLATAAIRETALSWAGASLIGLGLFIKARLEERLLRSEIGADSYADYARRVPMLMPFSHRQSG